MAIVILGTVRFSVEAMAKARPVMERMVTATRAEDGCIAYAFAEDLLDSGLIRISEIWASQAALDAHAASAHMAEWRRDGAALGIHDRDLQIGEVAALRPL